MKFELLHGIEAFQRLRPDWDALYRRDPEAQFFLSWQWLAGVLESHPGEWVVLVAQDEQRGLAGCLPLQLKTVWSKTYERIRNELHFAGRLHWADYGGVLCLPEREKEVLSGLAGAIFRLHWSRFYLKNFRISDRRYEIFMAPFQDPRLVVEPLVSLINSGKTDNLVCPFVELPDRLDAYLDNCLSSNMRQKVRRLLRQLDSNPQHRTTITDPSTLDRDVEILCSLWKRQWAPTKGSDADQLTSTYGEIVARGLRDSIACLWLFWADKTPHGALACFVDREKSRLLFFVAGRDAAFCDLPVGLVLHIAAIRWAIENGIRIYDLLRGNEPYKYSLGARDTRIRYPLIRTTSGLNIHKTLEPATIGAALHLASVFAERGETTRALTVCRQVLASAPQPEKADGPIREPSLSG